MTSRSGSRVVLAIALVLALAAYSGQAAAPLVTRVATVGFTVSDLDRSVGFFTDVLTFEREGEREVFGRPFELLQGVFGMRARIAILRLGDERIELTEYLAPVGRPIPSD